MMKEVCFLPATFEDAQAVLKKLRATWSRLEFIRLESIIRRKPEYLERLGLTPDALAGFLRLVAIAEAQRLLTECRRDPGSWLARYHLGQLLVFHELYPEDLGLTAAEFDRLVALAA
jgi:hypothetical protein